MSKKQLWLIRILSISLVFTLAAGVIAPAMAGDDGLDTAFEIEEAVEDVMEGEEEKELEEELEAEEQPAEEMEELDEESEEESEEEFEAEELEEAELDEIAEAEELEDEEEEEVLRSRAVSSNINLPGIDNDIVLSEVFSIPAGSDSKIHETNKNQVVITEAQTDQQGHIWYNYKVDLSVDFEISSRIYLGDNPKGRYTDGGDGLAFVMHNDPAGTNAVGGVGSGLGFGHTASSTYISNGLAVEFDTYPNYGSSNAAERIDREVFAKHKDMTGYNFRGTTSNSSSNLARTDNHLLHVAVLETPGKSSTVNEVDYIHGALSIFSSRGSAKEYNKTYAYPAGNGHTTVYEGVAESAVFKKWHNLNMTWDAENYVLTYELGGGSDGTIYTKQSYTIGSEAELRRIFNLSGDSKQVYWGFTGSTGSAVNYQSVAIGELPSHVEAEASIEAGKVNNTDDIIYGTEVVDASLGDRVSYRAMVKYDGDRSHIPLAGIEYQDVLDGVTADGKVLIKWQKADGSEQEQVIDIIEGDRAGYHNSMGLKAYFNESDGIFHVYGLGTLGESDNGMVSESLSITYQVVVTEPMEKLVNDNDGFFYSGTKTALNAGTVPIQTSEYIEPDPGELQMIVPETINFGEGAISPVMKTYPATVPDEFLVLDTRDNRGWELKAKLHSPLQNEDGTVRYEEALIYRNGGSEYILSTTDIVSIERADQQVDETTDIKENWYTGDNPNGIFLRFNPGEGRLGNYKAIIVWELQDVPGQG